MIPGQSYTRRCKECLHTQTWPLPIPVKKLLYLDQFFVSNVAKLRDPKLPTAKRQRLDVFYEQVANKIERLCQLQAITCPQSSLHENESMVAPNFESIREVYRALSGGNSFLDPIIVRDRQLLGLAKKAAGFVAPEQTFDRRDVLFRDPNEWQDWVRIEVNAPVFPGATDELRQTRDKKAVLFKQVYQAWASDKETSFRDRYREERRGLCRAIRERWERAVDRYHRIQVGELQLADEDALAALEPNMRLLMEIKTVFHNRGFTDQESFQKTWEFLDSDALDNSPYVRTSSLLLAMLARRAANQQASPEKHPFVDIDMIAAYLPFCDAMFIDKGMHSLLEEQPLKRELPTSARVFSMRNKSEFLGYLDLLEQEISDEHWKIVREIYSL